MSPFAKNLLGLLVAAIVAGALGLYAYFGVMKGDERKALQKETEERLYAAPGAEKDAGGVELTALTVEAKGELTELTRQDGRWRLTRPVVANADRAAVDGLVSQLTGAKFKSVVEEQPTEADLKRYGLSPPKFTVRAKAVGAPDLVLYGGLENTFDGSVYLRREGDPKVYAAEGGVRWSLERGAFDLREKELLAVDEPSLKKLTLKTKAGTTALERVDGKRWRLTAPAPAAADSAALSALVNGLKTERALAFLEETPELKKALETAPAADATFTTEAGEVRLRLAEATVGGEKKTVSLKETPGSRVLAEVSANALAVLSKSPADLKDKAVLSFKKEDVARVTFSPGGGAAAVVVERVAADAGAAEDWRVSAPQAGPAKKFKLSSVLWTLESLKALAPPQERARELKKLQLDERARRITLSDSAGKTLAELALGGDVPGKSGSAYVRAGKDTVAEVDGTRLAELPWSAAELLEGAPNARSDGGTPRNAGAN